MIVHVCFHAFLLVQEILYFRFLFLRPVFLQGLITDANYDYFALKFCGNETCVGFRIDMLSKLSVFRFDGSRIRLQVDDDHGEHFRSRF